MARIELRAGLSDVQVREGDELVLPDSRVVRIPAAGTPFNTEADLRCTSLICLRFRASPHGEGLEFGSGRYVLGQDYFCLGLDLCDLPAYVHDLRSLRPLERRMFWRGWRAGNLEEAFFPHSQEQLRCVALSWAVLAFGPNTEERLFHASGVDCPKDEPGDPSAVSVIDAAIRLRNQVGSLIADHKALLARSRKGQHRARLKLLSRHRAAQQPERFRRLKRLAHLYFGENITLSAE